MSHVKDNLNINLEKSHVEDVYEVIAQHFSGTRYKPWPHIAEFLSSFPPGSFVADVGCGNGKYGHVNENIIIHGSDMFVILCFYDLALTVQ